MAIIQTFGKSEKSMDKIMNIVTKFGGQKAAETQQILGAFVDKNGNPNTKAQTEFLLNVSEAKTSAEADRLLNFYGSVSQNEGILDVGVMVNYFQNNPEAAARLEGLLGNIKDNEGKLTYDVVTNFLPPTGDVAINKEYFNKLNQSQRTVYTQEIATIVSMSDAQITRSDDFKKWLSEGKPLGGAQYANLSFANQRAKYADAIGQKVTNNRVDLAIAPPTTTGTTDGSGTKSRDTTLDELLKKLKFVRDASINAEGSLKYLMKVVSGDGITKFAGVSQQLLTGLGGGGKGGFNREFISMLEGMDNKTRAIYMTVKKGQVVLTNQGKALKVAFDEKVVGEYQDAQVKTLQDTIAQKAAFVKLKAAGVDTTTALEMVSDANLAVAINAKKITSAELVRMASAAKAAKDSTAKLAIELEKVADAAKNDLTDAFTKLKALMGAKGLGFDTESLKIIADSPELVQSMTQLLAGKGTKKGLEELKTKIINMINNIKDLKVIIDVDINGLTNADVATTAFNDAKDKFDIIANGLIDNINKTFDPLIKDAEDKVQDNKDKVEDIENKINSIQETLDKVTKAFDDFTSALGDAISLATDDLGTALADLKKLDIAALAKTTKIPESVLSKLVDSTQAVIEAQNAVDAQTKLIKSMTDAQNIDVTGLAPYRGKDAGSFKTMGSIADAERQIAIVENNIKTQISNKIEDAQQFIDGQQRTLEVGYTRLIEDVQKKIAAIERNIAVNFEIPLKNMQEESSKLSEDLAVMDKAADAVNDKYTKQEEALSKIAEINQDIVEQQKQQLGLADALSKGDISAAAAAVQEIRASQAGKSLGAQQGSLGKAKEAELAAIKSPSGLTRDQIAERQYAIERSSYRIQQLQTIEQQKIVDFQEQIYRIETDPGRLDILDLIKAKEEEIYNLDLQRTYANNAIRTVQDQIAASNLSIGAQQATLAGMESTLATAQETREKAMRAAETAHKKYVTELNTALTAAQTELKNANTLLATAEKALADLIKERDKQIKQITDEKDKMEALEKSIAAMAAGIDLATISVDALKTAFTNAETAAQNLINKLKELNTAKEKQNQAITDEAGAAAAGYSRVAIDARAEVKRLEEIIAKLDPNTMAYEKASKAKDAAQETSVLYDKIAQLFKDVLSGTMSLAAAKLLAAPLLGKVDNAIVDNPTVTPTGAPTAANTGGGGGGGGSGTGSSNGSGNNQTGNTSITNSPVGTIKTYPSGTKVEKVRDAAYNGSTLVPSLYKVSSPGQNTFYYTQDTLPAMYKAKGGLINRFASGGIIPKMFAAGGFSKGTDTIPAMLTPGEFVIKKSSVDSYGVNNLSKINNGMSPDSSVYNYSLSVNVSGNNLNADDIASTVMQKIKYIDGQRVRGQR
jgi:archaellum component FlaC